ncbi:hypothetical protein [Pseudoalteromonas sp. MEBiC 03485]|nr:hypothetical protein [Pseudoalteromonas sp. MEBiC 03485]
MSKDKTNLGLWNQAYDYVPSGAKNFFKQLHHQHSIEKSRRS